MDKFFEYIKKYDILILVILGFLLYFPVLSFDFLGIDDNSFILKNPYLNGNYSINLFQFFIPKLVIEAVYTPLTFIVYWVIIKFWGQNASVFHFVNIFFYLLSCVALLFLFKKILKNDLLSFWATVLYLIHPVHVEYVVWIAALGYNIASFFAFLSMIFFVSAFDDDNKLNFIYSSIFYLLSVLSQPATVVVAVFPIIWMYFFRKEKFLNSIKYFIPNCLISMIYLYLSCFVISQGGRAIGFKNSFLQKIQIIGNYLINSFFPIFQKPIYSLPSIWYLIPLFILIILIILIKKYNLIKNNEQLYFWSVWYLISILPYLGFFFELAVSNRYLILPSVSSCVALSYLCVFIFNKLRNSNLLRFFIPLVFFVFYFISSILYIPVWKNNKSFWTYAYNVNSESYLTAGGFAYLLIKEGRFSEALIIADDMIKKYPELDEGYDIKIKSLIGLLEFKQALEFCFDFKKIKPDYYNLDIHMFTAYFNMGNYDKAEKALINAEELYKKCNYYKEDYTKLFLDKKIMLAYCKVEVNKFFEALRLCNDRDIDNLLQDFSSKSLKYEQKEKSCLEFLRNYPKNKYLSYILMLLNTLYMENRYKNNAFNEMNKTSQDMVVGASLIKQNKLDEAEKIYLSVLERDKYIYNAYSNLGLIYIRIGKKDKAVNIFNKALEINPNDEKVKDWIEYGK